MEICSLGGKITKNPTSNYSVWMTSKKIILGRWKIDSFDELDWEVVRIMTPAAE